MNLAPPIPGFGRPFAEPEERERKQASDSRRSANRTPSKDLTQALQRERHAPDYMILVVVVALAAIGIHMVYSSSAMRGYLSAEADTFQTVGPQIQWALLGLLAMVAMMRVDYRYLRLVSIPGYVIAIGLLVLVFVDDFNVAKLAMVIYLAHWFAKRGLKVGGFWGGTVPFLLIAGPVIALVFKEPDLGTTIVITLTAFTMWFVAGGNTFHLGSMVGVAGLAAIMVGLAGYQMDRIRAWLDPWKYADTIGYHTVQGLLALGLGGVFGSGLGESRMAGGLFVPNAFNDFIFAIIGEEFGLVGAGIVIALFVLLAYAGIRVALGAPDTFGALLAAGITALLCIQAFINIGVVVTLVPITGITLPFISAGGSSLIISFAAIGILLSISRETIEKGTWNDDATADRRRRNGRAHLPGSGRRPVAARATGRR